MVTPRNRYNLTRNIPSEVKRAVRQKSKFGCVNCRSAIYEYEHINPSYSEAKIHDPDAICLLCGCCHSAVTRGHISKETILRKYIDVQSNPEIKRPFGDIDVAGDGFSVHIGNNKFINSCSIISLDNIDILRLDPPEDDGGPPLLSGIFFDHVGREIFRIERNVWHGPADAWDMDIVGNKIRIRTQRRKLALEVTLLPPSSIVINHVDMNFHDMNVYIDKEFRITRNEYNARRTTIFSNFMVRDSSSCIHLMTDEYVDSIKSEGLYHAFSDGKRVLIGRGAKEASVGSFSIRTEPLVL